MNNGSTNAKEAIFECDFKENSTTKGKKGNRSLNQYFDITLSEFFTT